MPGIIGFLASGICIRRLNLDIRPLFPHLTVIHEEALHPELSLFCLAHYIERDKFFRVTVLFASLSLLIIGYHPQSVAPPPNNPI